MLKGIRFHRYIVVAVIFVIAIGCNEVRYVIPINMEEAKPSFTHTLELINETQNVATVIPPEDSEALPLAIAPGESKEIKFVVIRVAQKDENDNITSVSSTVMVADSEGYVGMENIEGLLQIMISENEVWDYLISLRGCWSNNPQTDQNEIKVNQEPDITTPLRLCEQI